MGRVLCKRFGNSSTVLSLSSQFQSDASDPWSEAKGVCITSHYLGLGVSVTVPTRVPKRLWGSTEGGGLGNTGEQVRSAVGRRFFIP